MTSLTEAIKMSNSKDPCISNAPMDGGEKEQVLLSPAATRELGNIVVQFYCRLTGGSN
jgi:hypothetical protein